jgi:YVTN family beta-propeller protein
MRKLLVLGFAVFALASCKKDEKEEVVETPTVTAEGIYVLNEGNFLANNASISYINSNNELSVDPFFDKNGVALGDVLQSFVAYDGKGFAVLNNSGKVEVFSLSDFSSVGTISAVSYPRYIVNGGNGKLYLSSGSMAGQVLVIDPSTLIVENTITVGNGPERMLVRNGKLFVCNSGGFAQDNTVSVIDLATNTVTNTITVGDRPIDIDVDAAGNIWVMCQGKTVYNEDYTEIIEETQGRLVRINATTLAVTGNETVGTVGQHPSILEISADGSTLFYVNGNVYAFSTTTADLPGTVWMSGNVGSLDIRSNGEVWTSSVSNYIDPSIVSRYSNTGELLNQFTVGMGTNGVVFN